MAHSQALLAQFERFWAAYPRRPDNPKAAAREVFARRIREGADPEVVIAAAGRFAAATAARGLDPMFTPHARTWLSQRRWEDYLEDAPASAPEPAPQADPSLEHPLGWLRPAIGDAAWRVWVEPLAVINIDGWDIGWEIKAQTSIALDHVRKNWGPTIEAHFGAPITWTVARRSAT